MKTSARNHLTGVVKQVKLGEIMAEVQLTVEKGEMVAAITRASAEQLNLKPGDKVEAIVKATEVMIGKE